MRFLRNHKRATVLGGILGTLGIGALAFALVFTGVLFSGDATVHEQNYKLTIYGVQVEKEQNMNCSLSVVDATHFTLNAEFTRATVNGQKLSSGGHSCQAWVRLGSQYQNQEGPPLWFTQLKVTAPQGWTITTPDEGAKIPMAGVKIHLTISAQDTASSGPISGKLKVSTTQP